MSRGSALLLLIAFFGLLAAPRARAEPAHSPHDLVEARIVAAKATMLADPAKAIVAAGKARDMAAALSGQRGQTDLATATWLLGEAYVRDNQLALGGKRIDEAMTIVKKAGIGGKLLGDVLLSRGNYRALTADVAGSLADFQAAYAVYRDINETRSEAVTLLTIATLHLDANDYKSGLKYVDQALQIYRGDPQLMVALHNNRGDMLHGLERYAEADVEFTKALSLARGMGSDALISPILRNMASNELAANKLAQADSVIAEALRIMQRVNNPSESAKVLALAAQLDLQRGDLRSAKVKIEQAFADDVATDDTQFWQAQKTAYEVYRALGDQKNALIHLEALKKLDDSTAKLAASTNSALMTARFDFANQELKIAKLQADEAKRRADTQFWIFTGAGVTAVVIVGMLGFGLVTIRKSRDQVRAANVDLASTNVALGKALAAKTEFLATTSHEIRTPLNGILGMTQVMLADQKLDPTMRDRIGVVHGAGVSMRALVDDILDVAKMETGNLTVEKAPVDLPAMLRDVSRMWEDQARAKGLIFNLDVSNAPSRIESDPARLRQVVFNLLSNALKFTQAGSIHVSSNVLAGTDSEQLAIIIRDTGIGIPAAKLDLIFESFRQADAGTTRQFGGTGLGLAICRNIAHAMGGDVTVASEEGEGSTFTFAVPLVRVAEETPVAADGDAAALLIVDKNPISRAMLKTLFTPRVASVKVAASITDAAAAIAAGGVDRVLTDELTIAMDGDAVDGVHALAGVPLSLLWTNPDESDRARFAAAGVDQLIAKPIAGAALVKEVVTATYNDDIASRAA